MNYTGEFPTEADPEVPIEVNLILTAYFDDFGVNFQSVTLDL